MVLNSVLLSSQFLVVRHVVSRRFEGGVSARRDLVEQGVCVVLPDTDGCERVCERCFVHCCAEIHTQPSDRTVEIAANCRNMMLHSTTIEKSMVVGKL